jgi:hypothetical protein
MVKVGALLLAYADAVFYAGYGRWVAEVNEALQSLVRSRNPAAWDRLFDECAERLTFLDHPNGTRRLREFLNHFGSRRLLHGRTPTCL